MKNKKLMAADDFLDLFYVASAGQDKAFIKTVEMIVEDTPAVDAVPIEAARPRWISVEERLPEPFISVLVYMPEQAPLPTVREGFRSNDRSWYAAYFTRETGEVTHWMPLPDAPKEAMEMLIKIEKEDNDNAQAHKG